MFNIFTRKLKVYLKDSTVLFPVKGSEFASGFDIYAHSDPILNRNYLTYKTGLIVEPPKGYDIKLYPRSSIREKDLILANSVGIIDEDYRGEIQVSFIIVPMMLSYITGNRFELITEANLHNLNLYKKGDKIAQLIVEKKSNCEIKFCDMKSLSKTDRGIGGFGSTGS